MMQMAQGTRPDDNIRVEITGPNDEHCFRLVFNPRSSPGQVPSNLRPEAPQNNPEIEIYLHATQLVDLVKKCCDAHSHWMHGATAELLEKLNKYGALLP